MIKWNFQSYWTTSYTWPATPESSLERPNTDFYSPPTKQPRKRNGRYCGPIEAHKPKVAPVSPSHEALRCRRENNPPNRLRRVVSSAAFPAGRIVLVVSAAVYAVMFPAVVTVASVAATLSGVVVTSVVSLGVLSEDGAVLQRSGNDVSRRLQKPKALSPEGSPPKLDTGCTWPLSKHPISGVDDERPELSVGLDLSSGWEQELGTVSMQALFENGLEMLRLAWC
ncbi:hypothetical protein F2Q68_00044029 [Brassica cretica]|uniref:Uncharacterized protein n=1 Tax=Brassica cretica TaxID=69181 RepID=A0A8S9LJC9_BRACR|nr:hypothetical protein F2Q68_00044029 [Brassica cretica]